MRKQSMTKANSTRIEARPAEKAKTPQISRFGSRTQDLARDIRQTLRRI